MEIIPAIIVKDFKDLEAKIKLVEPYVKTVQIDVMDGIFVDNKTWPYTEHNCHYELVSGSSDNNETPKQVRHDKKPLFSDDLDNLKTDVFLEVHLMVANPHRILNEWLNSKVKRVILHWEAMEKIHNHEVLPYKTQVGIGFPMANLAQEAHRNNKELGVALNLNTPITVLDNFINEIDMVLLMSVKPGRGGQEFEESVVPKIIALRQNYPNVKIEVDGGVNQKNILKLVKAGADFLVIGSAIFGKDDVSKAINELEILTAKY